jgi:hypothetical protein
MTLMTLGNAKVSSYAKKVSKVLQGEVELESFVHELLSDDSSELGLLHKKKIANALKILDAGWESVYSAIHSYQGEIKMEDGLLGFYLSNLAGIEVRGADVRRWLIGGETPLQEGMSWCLSYQVGVGGVAND